MTETTTPFNLRAARLDAGFTTSQLADHIGVNPRTYQRLENGQQVSPAIAKKIADHFGVKVTDLPAFADEITAQAA